MIRSSRAVTLLTRTAAIFAAAMFTMAGCSDDRPTPVTGGGTGGAMAAADAGGGSDTATSGCVADTGPVDPSALLDDFEDTDAEMPLIAGRMGGWFASGDGTATAILQPSGAAAPEPIPGGRCGSRRALHVTGAGFNDWGSLVGVAMHYGANSAGTYEELPYDARARGYQGLTFFARIGDTSTATVRFAVSDQYARPEAGLCILNGSTLNGCYDTFGIELTRELTTQWKEFRIPWTGMSQRNFGLQGGLAPDVSKLYDISFTFPGGVIFDLWVDDIRFY
jgi:hypothetical protein